MNTWLNVLRMLGIALICTQAFSQPLQSSFQDWLKSLESGLTPSKIYEEGRLGEVYRSFSQAEAAEGNVKLCVSRLTHDNADVRTMSLLLLLMAFSSGDRRTSDVVEKYGDSIASRASEAEGDFGKDIVRLLAHFRTPPLSSLEVLRKALKSSDRELQTIALHTIVKLSTLHPPATDIALDYLRNRLDKSGELITAIQAMPMISPSGADPRFGEFFAVLLPRADVELTEALCLGFSRLGSITTKALPALRAEVNSPLRSNASKEAASACIANLEAQVRRGW